MWIIIGLVALAIGILCWLRFKPKRGATSPDDVSITALRNAVTTAGGTPASYTYEALLRQLITAWGGTPIYFDIINLLRSGITVLGGTPASYQEVSLLRELITQLGGTPVSFNSETLYDQLATVSNSNDTTPNQFTFADYTDINTSQLQFSVTITVSGLGPGLTVTATLTGDASSRMSVDTGSGFGAFVAGPVAGLKNGDKIFLRQMSAAAGLTTVSTTLTVGTTSDTWTTTTIGVLAKPTLAINSALGATPLDLVFSTSDYVVGDYAQLWVASDSGFSTITQNIVFFIDGNSWSTKDIGIGLANPTAAYWARIRTFRDNTEGGQTTITDGNGNSYVGDVSAWSDPVNDPWTAFKGFTIATVKPSTISTGATATFTGLDLKGGGRPWFMSISTAPPRRSATSRRLPLASAVRTLAFFVGTTRPRAGGRKFGSRPMMRRCPAPLPAAAHRSQRPTPAASPRACRSPEPASRPMRRSRRSPMERPSR
jgi:hypothetical protein